VPKNNCKRQKYNRTKGTYGENQRGNLHRINMREKHKLMIEQLSCAKNSSRSCVLESIVKRVLFKKRVEGIEVIRRKSIPAEDVIRNSTKYTISKDVLHTLDTLATEYETKVSIILWHLLTVYFTDINPFLMEYQESL